MKLLEVAWNIGEKLLPVLIMREQCISIEGIQAVLIENLRVHHSANEVCVRSCRISPHVALGSQSIHFFKASVAVRLNFVKNMEASDVTMASWS